jgi:peroxiredoxin
MVPAVSAFATLSSYNIKPGEGSRYCKIISMKKSLFALAGILALAILAAALWYRGWQPGPGRTLEDSSPVSPGSGPRMAPPFTLTDTSGNQVSSSLFLGKPIVINFFATWCPPCRQEIPGFVEVYNKYRGRGFELVGISLDSDTKRELPAFMMENRIGYRILMGDIATARAYGGVTTIPTTFFVGRDGRIRNVHVGYIDKDAFEREVQKLL